MMFCLVVPVFGLTGCYDQPPMPKVVGHDASGNAVYSEQDAGLSAGETVLAAGAGAAVGSVVGNMISAPRNSGGGYVPRSTTIIQKKTVIINNRPPVKRSWYSSSRSYGGFGRRR